MKNVTFLLLCLFSMNSNYGQNDSIKKSSVDVDFNWGIGLQVQDFSLNSVLASQGLADAGNTQIQFVTGFGFFGKKYSGDVDFIFGQNKSERNNSEMRYGSFGINGKFHLNLINEEKTAVTAGVSLLYQRNQMNIFDNTSTLDFNNISANGGNNIEFFNRPFFAGPSVSFFLFKKSFPIRVNATYELMLGKGRWRTDYGNITNAPDESGNNRFMFSLIF